MTRTRWHLHPDANRSCAVAGEVVLVFVSRGRFGVIDLFVLRMF